MLNTLPVTRYSGFSLIELMIGIMIMAILLGLALPSFQSWTRNTQIRNAAESITNGLQRARAEAVARNVNVTFALLGDDASCSASSTCSSWTATAADGTVIDSRASSEGSTNVTRTALATDLVTAATTITYNSLGQVVASAASLARVNLTATGGTQDLRVEIGAGGGARMCDPSLSVVSNPRGC